MKIDKIHPNPNNTRDIDQEKFEKLKESIQRDGKFMRLRPIIYQPDGMIIGGNMRYRALVAMEYKIIPDGWTLEAAELTEDEKHRFQIIDNMGFGFFDWEIITSFYSDEELIEWGLDLPVEPITENEEVPPVSHSFKIQCDSLDELIELREMLDVEVESKSISFGNFRLIFEKRIN